MNYILCIQSATSASIRALAEGRGELAHEHLEEQPLTTGQSVEGLF